MAMKTKAMHILLTTKEEGSNIENDVGTAGDFDLNAGGGCGGGDGTLCSCG